MKLKSPKDEKRYKTYVADTEQLLCIMQSIPSKKAEPFEIWLAKVGCERIEEIIDSKLAIDRALDTYLKNEYMISPFTDNTYRANFVKGDFYI